MTSLIWVSTVCAGPICLSKTWENIKMTLSSCVDILSFLTVNKCKEDPGCFPNHFNPKVSVDGRWEHW